MQIVLEFFFLIYKVFWRHFSYMKRSIILAVTAFFVILTIVSCGERNPLRSSSEDKKVVMNIGSEKVKFEEYRYFWLNNKRDLYGEDAALDADQINEINSLTENNVLDRHGLRLLADEYGVELTSEDQMRTDAYVDSFKTDCGSDEAYKEQLLAQYINEPFLKELTADTTIAYALLDEMAARGGIAVSEDDYAAALLTDEVLCIKEIYISYPDESLKDWAKGRAEDALARLEAGESFEALMTELSDYNGDDLPPEHGYYTMQYDALDEIWEAASALSEGGHSRVIETDFGFHIVMRAKKDVSYMEGLHDELFEVFRQSRFYRAFYEFIEGVEVEYTSFGEKLAASGVEE